VPLIACPACNAKSAVVREYRVGTVFYCDCGAYLVYAGDGREARLAAEEELDSRAPSTSPKPPQADDALPAAGTYEVRPRWVAR
jgi:hypothetical protein